MINSDYLNQHVQIKEMGAKFVYAKMPKEIVERTVSMQDIIDNYPRGGTITLKGLQRKHLVGDAANYLRIVDAVPTNNKYRIIAHKFGLNVVKNVIERRGSIICIKYRGQNEMTLSKYTYSAKAKKSM